jgi:hypothetical protein
MSKSAHEQTVFEKEAQQRILNAIEDRQVADLSALPKAQRRVPAEFLRGLISGSEGGAGVGPPGSGISP